MSNARPTQSLELYINGMLCSRCRRRAGASWLAVARFSDFARRIFRAPQFRPQMDRFLRREQLESLLYHQIFLGLFFNQGSRPQNRGKPRFSQCTAAEAGGHSGDFAHRGRPTTDAEITSRCDPVGHLIRVMLRQHSSECGWGRRRCCASGRFD